ncbi:MAG: glycosyltransferase [Chitinophagaceae bacterium]
MNKKKVLLFYPPNKRSVAIETVCKAVKEAGHEIVILTLSERGAFHEAMEKEGIETLTYEVLRKPSWKFFYKHTRNIISFCKKRKIDFVWSHLQRQVCLLYWRKSLLKQKL